MTDMPVLNPSSRHEIFIVISATMSNPNGDPDANNAPRTNPYTNHGYISAASIKRKVRDVVTAKHAGQPGMGIFIRHGEVMSVIANSALSTAGMQVGTTSEFDEQETALLLDAGLPEAFRFEDGQLSYDGTLKKAELDSLWDQLGAQQLDGELVQRVRLLSTARKQKGAQRDLEKEAVPVMVREFWDCRMFGYTAPGSAGKTRGPVQISDAVSLEPVTLIAQTGTRVARSKVSDEDGSGNFARKEVVDHAVYVATAYLNPNLAAQHQVSSQDLQALLEGLWYGQEFARSSSRPDVRVEALVIVSHENPWGSARFSELERRLRVSSVAGQVTVTFDDENLPGITAQIIQG